MIDRFHGSDRTRVLEAVVDSPGFTGPAQRECVRTAAKLYGGKNRRRILVKIAESPRATPETRKYAHEMLIKG